MSSSKGGNLISLIGAEAMMLPMGYDAGVTTLLLGGMVSPKFSKQGHQLWFTD
jgi:hypothetical protein